MRDNTYDFDKHVVRYHGDRITCYAKDDSYHQIFDRNTGFTVKYGKTLEEDPLFNPFGPEIADIEVTTKCSGIRLPGNKSRSICPFCYHSNTPEGNNMSFDTFKQLFDKITQNKTLTQIAFGADASLTSNPDIWEMFDYCIAHDVTPNVTVADIDKEVAERLVHVCGAVAVSWYPLMNEDCCFDSIKLLVDEANKQNKRYFKVNMHVLLSDEMLPHIYQLVETLKTEERLKGLNAVVLLSLKQKGRGKDWKRVSKDDFYKLMDHFFENNVRFGMDSCRCYDFINYLKENDRKDLIPLCESCEALCFSSFFNVEGKLFPCSFIKHTTGFWREGINVLKCTNFEKEIWYHPEIVKYRKAAEQRITCFGCNKCSHYEI